MAHNRFIVWPLSAVVICAYISCAPPISVWLSGLLFRYAGTPTPELVLPFRAVWCVTTCLLGAIAIRVVWPESGVLWRLLNRPKRRALLVVFVFCHAIVFQSLWWQLSSALDALNIPFLQDEIMRILLVIYYPPISLFSHFEPYEQFNPAWWVVAISFSILVYSFASTILILTLIKVCYSRPK
jgi:hypothetical protein